MLVFENDSMLPIDGITTFGVSVKETDSPIGYFGTGLKYAIAVLLREGCNIVLETGNRKYKFTTVKKDIREKEFEFVFMADIHVSGETEIIKLPFTTELGKNWELWQAYRELWSNCRDENGTVNFIENSEELTENKGTRIIVNGLDEVHAISDEFLLRSKPKYILDEVEIHEVEEKEGIIFYKGIKVLELGTKFSYNITCHLDLTEDRTASQWDVENIITRSILTTTDKEAMFAVISVDDPKYKEQRFDYSRYVKPSEAFMTMLSKLRNKPQHLRSYYDHHYPDFIAVVGKQSLSTVVKNKISSLYDLLKFKPKEILISSVQLDDYRVVKESIVLSESVLKNTKRMKFAYLLACLSMQPKNKGKNTYELVANNLLQYFNFDTIKEEQNDVTK